MCCVFNFKFFCFSIIFSATKIKLEASNNLCLRYILSPLAAEIHCYGLICHIDKMLCRVVSVNVCQISKSIGL